ncbi:response regulator [Stappia sp. F7233]|uniref:Response regulator n=1 Tax=Stappia albiluteola TaxID=2758565 RepID=A0A839ACU6_9HYPH|nr:response regulator [Stappia albiluteola]MBA5776935.1 response regulator [Stappia albiluteola]
MTKHYAFGRVIEDLDIAVVDDSKPMQAILRSTLLSFRVRRVRTFDGVEEAIEAMRIDPPNLILTDWHMKPVSGYQLLCRLRHRKMAPLCYLPILFVTAHGTRTLVDKVLRAGAQNVLVKPISPSILFDRLQWTLRDGRDLELGPGERFRIAGVAERLDEKARKWKAFGEHWAKVEAERGKLAGKVAAREAKRLPKPVETQPEPARKDQFAAVRVKQ